jgi:hypothetical protein
VQITTNRGAINAHRTKPITKPDNFKENLKKTRKFLKENGIVR